MIQTESEMRNPEITKKELKSKIQSIINEAVSMRIHKRGSMRGFVTFSPMGTKYEFNWDMIQSIKGQFTNKDIVSTQDINIYMGTNWVWNH